MSNTARYSSPLTDLGDLLTKDEFRNYCEAGAFIDYDGFGHPVQGEWMDESIAVRPSRLKDIPDDATHVMWFNR